MKPKKYGALACLRNSVTRRHLFFNTSKNLSLDEILEYENCRCIDKHWEVSLIEVSENSFHLERKLVLATPQYKIAWDLVKDENHGRLAKCAH